MAANALCIYWDAPHPGKEGMALELFGAAMGYYERKKQEGVIETYQPVLLAPHGGVGGFILIRCAQGKLNQLRDEDEFNRLSVKGGILLRGFGIVDAHVGEALDGMVQVYRENL